MIQVAKGSNTHVLLMDDYQDGESITLSNLAGDHNFNNAVDLTKNDRQSRLRVNFVEKCDIDPFLRFFIQQKK